MNKYWIIGIVFCISISCKKKEAAPAKCSFESISGDSKSIIGQWKVVEYENGHMSPNGGATLIDLTCKDVFYEFLDSGVLKISSNAESFKSEESTFEPIRHNTSIIEIKINGSSWPCRLTENDLILDNRQLDGPILRMRRIR